MIDVTSQVWTHDASHIRHLQHAHADHIESIYTSLSLVSGNPDRIRMQRFGETRTFLASGERFTNRIILTGNESSADLDALFAYYDQHQAGCVLEVNPANFYLSNPFSWESVLVPALLARGCELRHFRCVWYQACASQQRRLGDTQTAQIFDHTRLDAYIALAQQAEPEQDWPEHGVYLCVGEGQEEWYHYVALDQETPIATASLYKTHELGYLAEAYTHPDHRRRGAHTLLIQARVQHAHKLGCSGVFSVTDSHTQSARDLQRVGFILAYNYLLFVRSPMLSSE